MCEYLTDEMANPIGLSAGWYTEDIVKDADFYPCPHIIPDGQEEILNSAVSHYEELLRDLRRQRKLVIKAKQNNLQVNGA